MKSRMGGISRAFLADKLRSAMGLAPVDDVEKHRIIQWCTLFRRNWDIFAEFYLGLKLRPYQRAALHGIGISDVFFWRAGRGGAKSYVTAIAAICKLLLYPNCWVVVTASTVDQANKIVRNKIEKELLHQSPILLYMMEQGWIKITKPTDGYVVECTLNNSTLTVLAPVESARGSRSNFTIYDEVAIMKKTSIDQLFEGMLYPRQAAYLSNPKYAKNSRWIEESKTIYLTSSKYKWMWWYNEWKKCVTGYYVDKRTKYDVFASDFFDNIDNGLKTWGDYRRAKRSMSDMDFRMELLNEAIGEAEDAFFSLKSFKQNQIMPTAFKPPSNMDIFIGKAESNLPKKDSEIRLIVVDFAFANTTSREKNDNTIIMCMSLHWKRNYFERHIDYMQIWEASDSIGAMRRVRELYFDYEADYIVNDQRSGGETIYNAFTEPWVHPSRGRNWNPRGFTIADKPKYQVVSNEKLNDLISRTVDKQAIPAIIPVIGSSAFNSNCWVELKKNLEYNRIKMLVSMDEAEKALVDNGQYFELSAEQLADELIPYTQEDLMIQEAVNLKTEIKSDNVKLVEPKGATKDRIVALAYGNYIASLIENEWNKDAEETELNWEDIQCVW